MTSDSDQDVHLDKEDESGNGGPVTETRSRTSFMSVMLDETAPLNGKPIRNLVNEHDVKTSFYSTPMSDRMFDLYACSGPKLSIVRLHAPDTGPHVIGWKYWRPQIDGFYKTGRGQPNYIAEWELTRIGDDWYHIDNPSQSFANFDGNFPQERYVPYSHSTPISGERHSSACLGDAAEHIRGALGQLYSVPPDSRVPLAFERNQLRLAHEEGRLAKYLTDVGALFKELASAGGSFRVVDFDDFMNSATYYSKNDVPTSSISDIPQGFLARHCLDVEEFTLDIPPALLRVGSERPIDWSECLSQERQWHRLVHFHGLGQMSSDGILKSAFETRSSKTIWGRVFRSWSSPNDEYQIGLPARVLSAIFDLHIFCRRHQGSRNPYLVDWNPFHISWYRIIEADAMSRPIWKSGTLYETGKFVQQSAFTAGLFPQRIDVVIGSYAGQRYDWLEGNSANNFYWTIFLLSPNHIDLKAIKPTENPPIHTQFLYFIADALQSAADSWDEIAVVMEGLLDEGDAVLNLQKHDSLLFDDKTFSRSRRYFWAVDSLDTFNASILDTLNQWNMWWEAWEQIIKNSETVHTARVAARRRQELVKLGEFTHDYTGGNTVSDPLEVINRQIRRLEGLKSTFRARLQKTQTLREALFSASSVMESREATDLGKTVKLLTYVSIFYLPLGVCAGMFSVDADYGLTTFGIVTVVTAVTTYFLVANLENVVSVLRRTPDAIRNPFINKMAQDTDKGWKKKGQGLKDTLPNRIDTTPSEWRIIQYAGIQVARSFGLFTRRRKAANEALP